MFFYVCIKSQVRDSRNKVMHSSSMKLSHSDFINFVDAMIDLLEDPGPLGKMPGAQEAVRNIQEVSVLNLFFSFLILKKQSSILGEFLRIILRYKHVFLCLLAAGT